MKSFTKLANPSRFALNPPTPFYSTSFQAPPPQSASSAQPPSNGSNTTSKSTTPIITNPQSFVVPLGTQPTYPHAQYSMFAASATQYPTAYYHQYAYAPPAPAFYPQQPILATGQSQLQTTSLSSGTTTINHVGSSGLLNQGAWSEEETQKLKKLAEESRSFGAAGDIEWDWVVSQYGNSRTRSVFFVPLKFECSNLLAGIKSL